MCWNDRMRNGFTLIELMIVVTVLAIIAAVAFPSYGNYVLRANRAVAKSAILRIAGQQESFYTDRKQYATALDALGTEFPAATVFIRRDGNIQAGNDGSAIYSVTLTGASAAAYTILATPVNSQARDTACGALSYTSTGQKSAASGATDCWSR